MWFVIGKTRYSEVSAGWGETPEQAFQCLREAFQCLSEYGDPELDRLRWFHCEHPAKVLVIPSYKFELLG